MYEKSCEILYEMIAKRICARKNKLCLSNKEISSLAKPSLMSAILHNKHINKKNAYLIPNGVTDNGRSLTEEIAENLKFSSPVELILGTYKEIDSYLGFWFRQIILDALECESKETIEEIEDILSDYVPYALVSSYEEAKAKHGDILDLALGNMNKNVIEGAEQKRDLAIAYIYDAIKDELYLNISNIFDDQPNTIKLNKRISRWFNSDLITIMEANRKSNPFLSNAKKQLMEGYDLIVEYELYEEALSPETIGYHENDTDYFYRNHIWDWFDALYQYIEKLGKIDGEPNRHILENRWNEKICLEGLS